MNKRFLYILLFWGAAIGFSACSDFQKILKSDNVDKKYEAALKYYDKKDYYKAGMLLEELIPLLKGRPESEKAQFLFANSHYYQRDYVLSSYYFRNFYDTYPRSEFAEEAMFMHAKSLYRDSPSFELDQTSTFTAIEAIQEYLNRYPQTTHKDEANEMYDDLSAKLEVKAFESARLYHQLRRYQSAVVALTNFTNSYPASAYSEEASFLRIEAQYNYAKESVQEKQRDRYYEVIGFYQAFVDKYPQSKYLRTAEGYYTAAQNQLEKLRVSASKE
ncbi:outer membrane protein assembly factor BamD [Adhaeribacter soli]|uniref:Outer membrane protein assembly factor BamD n=1 Tax=Adhaeribacter soli TaxID=2607655 RepID=A0A5N1IQX5_9BACT|nr:outer membrane protein assembly factor BamD [Adhaeribacter soli]KAA9327346.1 outer membrane protein assembly factor BamD [Adhaeribacter soli]